MGMFDYVRSSMYLGREFTGECQTKDIDQYGGGTMSVSYTHLRAHET